VAKLPLPPPPEQLVDLGLHEDDVVAVAPHTVLLRIHRTAGAHPGRWDEFRHYGPVPTARFDPHLPPPRVQAEGVGYAALSLRTCLAEVFQADRVVDRHSGAPYLTGWRPVRVLRLLDLGGTWPTRAGASQALNSGPRDRAQAWARAIRAAFPRLDGVWYPSSMDAGQPCVALYLPAESARPRRPVGSWPLAHPGLAVPVSAAVEELGYLLL
jgi:hypothetical protein